MSMKTDTFNIVQEVTGAEIARGDFVTDIKTARGWVSLGDGEHVLSIEKRSEDRIITSTCGRWLCDDSAVYKVRRGAHLIWDDFQVALCPQAGFHMHVYARVHGTLVKLEEDNPGCWIAYAGRDAIFEVWIDEDERVKITGVSGLTVGANVEFLVFAF